MTTVDLESVRLQITSRLPGRTRWMLFDSPLDHDFSRARAPLRPVGAEVLDECIFAEWRRLHLFGERDYAEGGGGSPFLCVHDETGEIWGLDVEREADRPRRVCCAGCASGWPACSSPTEPFSMWRANSGI